MQLPWSSEEDSYLIENLNKKGNQQLVKALGRTNNAIKNRMKTLGLRRDPEFVKELLRTQSGRSGEENANWKGGISQNHYHYKKLQYQRYPERVRAREAVKKALKSGKLERGSCFFCKSTAVQAHHEDYSKPLEVFWLCRKHHRAVDSAELSVNRMRPVTVPIKKITKESIALGKLAYPESHRRPVRRSECESIPRPCPFVSCQYNLFIDVNPETGSIKYNFPWLEPLEMKNSCALDVAQTGGKTLQEVGILINLTRERVRQEEARILGKLSQVEGFEDWITALEDSAAEHNDERFRDWKSR